MDKLLVYPSKTETDPHNRKAYPSILFYPSLLEYSMSRDISTLQMVATQLYYQLIVQLAFTVQGQIYRINSQKHIFILYIHTLFYLIRIWIRINQNCWSLNTCRTVRSVTRVEDDNRVLHLIIEVLTKHVLYWIFDDGLLMLF